MKPGQTSRIWLLCLATLGCSVHSVTPGPPVTVVERVEAVTTTPTERFMRYFSLVRTLSPEALRQERARQDLAFAEHRSPEHRLRLALVLSLPGTDGNRPYALELLHSYLQTPEPAADWAALATFLVTFMQDTTQPPRPVDPLIKHLQAELQEKERHLAAQQQRVRKLQEDLEAQRATQQTLTKQLHDAVQERARHVSATQRLHKTLQDERRNVKRLQDKIEKIKDIEKSLMERERTDNKGT